MITSKDKIQKFLNDQWNIIVDLHICTENLSRLAQNKYDYEPEIKRRGFFSHYYFQLKFVAVIQLSKLFSCRGSDKRSFFKLFNLLTDCPYDDTLNQTLKDNNSKSDHHFKTRDDIIRSIGNLKMTLGTERVVSLRTKVQTLRDKVYAHSDPGNQVDGISTIELAELVELAADTYNEISSNLLDTTAMFDHVQHWNIDSTLRDASETWTLDRNELAKLKSGR